jgi:hypothetical protein
MDTRVAMWVHGVSALPERTAGDAGADGPLTQAYQIPWSDIVGLRQGYGASFRGRAAHDNWFHFAIPTPVSLPVFQPGIGHYDRGQGLRLEKVFVLYQNEVNSFGGAVSWVQRVDVWDGAETQFTTRLVSPRRDEVILRPDDGGPALVLDDFGGEHRMAIQENYNAWILMGGGGATITPSIKWGICVSVNVRFAVDSNILFASAGADFLLDVP